MSSGVQMVRGSSALPAYLQQQQVKGLDEAKDFIMHQRLKVVQKNADSETLNAAKPGSIVMMPSRIVVASVAQDTRNQDLDYSEPFFFTPVMFFASWGKVNDLRLRGQKNEPLFLDYTLDSKSDTARKAKNKATWEEPHPRVDGMKVKNLEMLNFLVSIHDQRFRDQVLVMTFAKAEWYAGSNFLSRIKNTSASIFTRVWQGSTKRRPPRNGGDWFGIDIVEVDDRTTLPQSVTDVCLEGNPPWLREDIIAQYDALHDKLKEQNRTQGIKPEGIEEDVASATAETPSAGEAEKAQY